MSPASRLALSVWAVGLPGLDALSFSPTQQDLGPAPTPASGSGVVFMSGGAAFLSVPANLGDLAMQSVGSFFSAASSVAASVAATPPASAAAAFLEASRDAMLRASSRGPEASSSGNMSDVAVTQAAAEEALYENREMLLASRPPPSMLMGVGSRLNGAESLGTARGMARGRTKCGIIVHHLDYDTMESGSWEVLAIKVILCVITVGFMWYLKIYVM